MKTYRLYDTYIVDQLAEANCFRNAPRDEREVPSYEQAEALLPKPFWDGHEAAIACHDKAWRLAFQNLRKPTAENGFVSRYLDTAFNDNTFMWDSTFMMFFGQYGRRAFPFMGTLDNFYAKQHRDGYICREIRERDGGDCFGRHDPSGTGPNVMPWAEWHSFETTGDRERLGRVLPPLLAYYRWLRYNLSWPDGTYYTTGWGCGMDNQPRYPAREHVEFRHEFMSWIDACFQQIYAAGLLLEMARAASFEGDVSDLEREREALGSFINAHMWDEREGFYFDRYRDGTLNGVKTIGAYWGLLASVVPPDRARRMVAELENERTFKRPHRVPSLSADHPEYEALGGYWRGGIWSPTNYMVLSGLSRLGEDALAHEIATNHHDNVLAVFSETNTLFENYAPEHAKPGDPARPDFVGWTGVSAITVLFEYLFGLRAAADRNVLVWDVRLREAHGVKRYPFGADTVLGLACEERASESERPRVHIETNRPLTVELRWAGGTETLEVRP